jgi:hypothetical protein
MNPSSPRYRSVALSPIQKGAIGQFAFLATALVTGKGQVEAYTPAIDNEGRDAEIRRHLKRALAVGIQIKVAFFTTMETRTAKYLTLRFSLLEDRVQNDPRLWYFFAYYDVRELRFHGPVFLIPSRVFHKMGRTGKKGRRISFTLLANLAPDSHDRWSPYRVAPKDLGKRLLEIIDGAPLTASGRVSKLPSDSVFLGRANQPKAISSGTRVARHGRKYGLIRNAVLERSSLSAWYKGHLRVFSPFLLGTKAGDPHVLGYQFDGTSEEPLGPEGSLDNWRCLRVTDLTRLKALPGIWHPVPKSIKGHQNCIDHVDVAAHRPSAGIRQQRRAA